MAKISGLPTTDKLTGAEHLPIVQGDATKRVTMAAFRDLITPFLQYWYKGDKGDTGAAANTFSSLSRLKGADPVAFPSAILADGKRPPIPYAFVTGDFTGKADDLDVVELEQVPLSQGALLRGDATTIRDAARASLLVAAGGAGLIGYGGADVGRSMARTLAFYGVAHDSLADQTAVINAALAQAKADKVTTLLGHPQGIYNHNGEINIDGLTLDGQGCCFYATSSDHSALRVAGTGTGLRNVRAVGTATARGSQLGTCGLVVTASDFAIENVELIGDGAPKGFAGAGAFFFGARRGVIRNMKVADTHADGIHVTYGSKDLLFYGCSVARSGDDGFAVVSYRGDNIVCASIHTDSLLIHQPASRALSIVGGIDIKHYRPRLHQSSAAAIYVQSEASYDTYGVRDWCIRDFLAIGCVTGQGLDADFLQPVILIEGRDGVAPSAEGDVPLDVVDGFLSGRVFGVGARASAGLTSHSLYIRRLRYEVRLEEIVGAQAGIGALLGGEDCSGWLAVSGCNGNPFILSSTMTGHHYYERILGTKTRLQNPGNANQIHGDGANNFKSLRFDLVQFKDAPGQAIGGDFARASTSWRMFDFNGAVTAPLT